MLYLILWTWLCYLKSKITMILIKCNFAYKDFSKTSKVFINGSFLSTYTFTSLNVVMSNIKVFSRTMLPVKTLTHKTLLCNPLSTSTLRPIEKAIITGNGSHKIQINKKGSLLGNTDFNKKNKPQFFVNATTKKDLTADDLKNLTENDMTHNKTK